MTFETQNGATFCQTCGAESQEHGQETIVDEETLGAFSDQASNVSSKKLKQKSKKRKKRYRDEHRLVKATTIQIYTYVLKGWINDAINELDLEPYAKDLNGIILALWSKYLAKSRLAFTSHRRTFNSSRDIQVAITKRKRIISSKKIANFKAMKRRAEKNAGSQSLSEADYSGDTVEAKKQRRKAKRSFLDSISVSMSEDSSDATSYLSESTNGDESDDDEDSFDEDSKRIEEIHLEVLSRVVTKSHKGGTSKIGGANPKLDLNIAFSLFTLGMLLIDNSRFTIADILRFAKFGVINYKTAAQHVPPAIKVERDEEVHRVSSLKDEKLVHLDIRRHLTHVSSFLCLGKMNFMDPMILVEQYLKELSLPQRLVKMMKKHWNVPGLLKMGLFQTPKFKKHIYQQIGGKKIKYVYPPMSTPALTACALILMVLKYLFGLDDVSEYCQKRPESESFSILRWIKLSRQRAFLACKYSPMFHEMFNEELFDGDVHMAPSAWYEHTQIGQVSHRLLNTSIWIVLIVS